MRLVAVADTHLFHHELVVPAGDIFVHAGDLCRGGDLEELAEVAEYIRSLPHRHKVVVAGNHDWAFLETPEQARDLLGSDVHYLADSGITIEGVRFWGSPWQPEYNGWAFNLPRGSALAEKWAMIQPDTQVLVTHGPPQGIGDRSSVGAERNGCEDLGARVLALRPRLHLFGHIHEDGGATNVEGTTFVNVTTWECERPPSVIDLDPVTLEVTLVQIPPARR